MFAFFFGCLVGSAVTLVVNSPTAFAFLSSVVESIKARFK